MIQIPVEILVYKNSSGSTTLNLVIEKYGTSGPNHSKMKYSGFRNITIDEYNTSSSYTPTDIINKMESTAINMDVSASDFNTGRQ